MRAAREELLPLITARALRLLVQMGKLATDLETIEGLRDEDGAALVLRFYRLASHRYWKRQAGDIAQSVHRTGELGRAIGAYGEILCDAALGAARFVETARDVREWNGRRWDRTEHDLDRVYVCDGVAYGCEIKNTLKYFPPEERRVKEEMRVDGAEALVHREVAAQESHVRDDQTWRVRDLV